VFVEALYAGGSDVSKRCKHSDLGVARLGNHGSGDGG
jgi:hypothetical protein